MVDLPKKKVGLVACSGEELPEGTVTRLAVLRVLEQLRPTDTVTICLPLFLAGGEADRAFARFYPTIAVDGCELRCAARATEMLSGKPAASIVVTELIEQRGIEKPQGARQLDQAGIQAVDFIADLITQQVDEVLDRKWSRSSGSFIEPEPPLEESNKPEESVQATCACGSGIPISQVMIEGKLISFVALPLIFEQLHQAGKQSTDGVATELLETVRIYNPIPDGSEQAYTEALQHAFAMYCSEKEAIQ